MSARLSGRTALVTGATSNIGRAIALAFGREGALVAVSGRDQARGTAVAEQIRAAGGRAVFVPAELDGSAAAAGSWPSGRPGSWAAGSTSWSTTLGSSPARRRRRPTRRPSTGCTR